MNFMSLLTESIDLRDYPDYAATTRATSYPGLALCEYYAASGIRYTVSAGCAASIAYFYLFHRPRLSFADRSLSKVHHYFFPSAGYSTPIGLVGGVGVGLQRCSQDLSPERLNKITEKERAEATMASQQYAQRRSLTEAQLRGAQSLTSRLLVSLGLCADPVHAELARLGFGEPLAPWQSLLVRNGVLWTGEHSRVHDTARYRDYDVPVVERGSTADASTASGVTSAGSAPPLSTTKAHAISPHISAPSTTSRASASSIKPATFNKLQIDALVSKVSLLRASPDEDRWMRTAGRCSTYGVLAMLLAWNSGNGLFRLQMGLGLGVMVGAAVSATRLDQMFANL